MTTDRPLSLDADSLVPEVVRRHWGFDALRPLQAESIGATLAGRDALTVMPTGGGKSLCYQVPPMVTGRLTLVVSPLIALMQDQVAALKLAGIPAAAAHSNLSASEVVELREMAREGGLRLLFVAPERLLTPDMMAWVVKMRPGAIAIDEAHCISQWGHDFRPEYRRLAELREALPGIPMGAFTATATPRVREDIARQLKLREPVTLVGRFDRPNLTYRILPRSDASRQVREALHRHADRAGIVYCITRKETESLAEDLRRGGIDAKAYHAGMAAKERTRVNDHFRDERLNVVCATVAFGMGIDRSDVRCVIHAAMPKSIEHYQQETGRAGRDGLPAECLMLHSGADVVRWKQIMQMGWEESGASPEALRAQFDLLEEMHSFATGARCRHRAISEYFGQEYEAPGEAGCGACDYCLHELTEVSDSHDTARKIISCVARVGQRFGAAHVAEVLLGSNTAKVRERGHQSLSTYGLLAAMSKPQVVGYINQLVDAGHLARAPGEYPVLTLTGSSGAVLKNEVRAVLVEPKLTRGESRAAEQPALSSEEQGLFEFLRGLRRRLAEARGVPPYIVFSDAVLEEVARVRPGSLATLVNVRGIGSSKARDFGNEVVAGVHEYCSAHALALDARAGSRPRRAPVDEDGLSRQTSGARDAAQYFRAGHSIEQVMARMERARSTVGEYLADFVARERPGSIEPWVSAAVRAQVESAIDEVGTASLRRLFERLGEKVPYETIKVVLACRQPDRGAAAARSG